MNYQNITELQVYYDGGTNSIEVGKLFLKNRKIYFEYSPEFLKSGLELSPFKLPSKPGVFLQNDALFGGLFGLFNDSLPDGWGRLLLDRYLTKHSINPSSLSPLDRLSFAGNHYMGALRYSPAAEVEHYDNHDNLDFIAKEINHFQDNDSEEFVEDLLYMSGSSCGARPKTIKKEWVVKFGSSHDPKDIGAIEYAYHLMARASRLILPDAKLFTSKSGPGYFASKRFDRVGDSNKPIHMHSISGLLHSDHRDCALDYENIMKATMYLTKSTAECEKQFRCALFNVLSYNRDDHGKNFSFLMDESGGWKVSPAYDLTFSSGPSGEHSTTIMGEGKSPDIDHFLSLGEAMGIEEKNVKRILDEVCYGVSQWSKFSKESGVSKSSQKRVQEALNDIMKNF